MTSRERPQVATTKTFGFPFPSPIARSHLPRHVLEPSPPHPHHVQYRVIHGYARHACVVRTFAGPSQCRQPAAHGRVFGGMFDCGLWSFLHGAAQTVLIPPGANRFPANAPAAKRAVHGSGRSGELAATTVAAMIILQFLN